MKEFQQQKIDLVIKITNRIDSSEISKSWKDHFVEIGTEAGTRAYALIKGTGFVEFPNIWAKSSATGRIISSATLFFVCSSINRHIPVL
jgi:hypothetical protein